MPKRVLIINGEKKLRTLFSAFLEKKGYSVLSAKNARQGLKVARTRCPDLILLDTDTRKMDGSEVLKGLNSDPRTMSIPVITLNGHGGEYSTLGTASLYFESDIISCLR